MGLKEYRRKRNFRITPEPAGKTAASRRRRAFVIQKHAASHLHYDFRLELDGVLKSWAVPKGPSLDPAQKRLAMQVENHPVEYGKFEGIIPPDQYGGGTVMLWDHGTWEPVDDPRKGYREGHLKFRLKGKKLHGSWMLVRKGGKHSEPDERHWFLFKERDDFAEPDTDITQTEPLSVTTGRDLEEIAANADRAWGPDGEHKVRKTRRAHSSRPKTNAHVGKAQQSRIVHAPASSGKKKSNGKMVRGLVKNEVAGVRLSHPDKVLYPDDGITKFDLAEHYLAVAERMLPYVSGRLLSLVRCPEGSGKPCFFQKHPSQGQSPHLQQTPVREKTKDEIYLSVDDLAGLISLVQMSVLEIHIWGSHRDQYEKPNLLIFDLDPDPAVDWPHVVAAAREIRLLLEELDLVSFVKTTGGKGLHIVLPIRRGPTWAEAKTFCRAVADFMVRAAPDRYIATMSKAARKGKIFVDYLRNDRGATSIAPYSTRAKPGAPVSVPITWDELGPDLKADHFNIENLPLRLKRLKKDPWAALLKTKQAISKSMLKKLQME
jgi:bifunctional non-homologous end joining protein LigD